MTKNITYSLVLFVLNTVLTASPTGKFGVNIDEQGAFINIVNHTARYSKAVGYDSLGWPLSDFELVLMDNRPVAEWSGTIDDPEEYRIDYSGIYKSSFIGQADISLYGSSATIVNTAYNPETNITAFELVIPGPPGDGHGFVYLTFKNTRRTMADTLNSGISSLKVLRPGYELNSSKTFTDEFISLCRAADFACYRFYTVQNIWDGEPVFPKVTEWENRKKPSDASQQPMAALNGKRDGWSWEYIIELANILDKDIWVCIHMSCDSNYVLSLARMLMEELNPGINIYVENSNEVWSPTQATHGPYNKAQADYNKISFDENYARRTVELSGLFSQVFGKEEINKRIRVILAGQHAYNGRSDLHLNFINKYFGAPKEYIYATSTALYFVSTKPNSTVDDILAGIDEDITSQINDDKKSTYRENHIAKAAKWELAGGSTSYEGGPHLPSGGGQQNLANQINAHRDEKMKDVIVRNFREGWFDLGGGLALFFTLQSGYNRYGCWGLTDDYTNPGRNYKMQAAGELAKASINSAPETEISNLNTELSINPNPCRGKFNIKIADGSSYSIQVINMNGICVFSALNICPENGFITLDLSCLALNKGIYALRLANATEAIFAKIVLSE